MVEISIAPAQRARNNNFVQKIAGGFTTKKGGNKEKVKSSFFSKNRIIFNSLAPVFCLEFTIIADIQATLDSKFSEVLNMVHLVSYTYLMNLSISINGL
jgi:hypothetical protein